MVCAIRGVCHARWRRHRSLQPLQLDFKWWRWGVLSSDRYFWIIYFHELLNVISLPTYRIITAMKSLAILVSNRLGIASSFIELKPANVHFFPCAGPCFVADLGLASQEGWTEDCSRRYFRCQRIQENPENEDQRPGCLHQCRQSQRPTVEDLGRSVGGSQGNGHHRFRRLFRVSDWLAFKSCPLMFNR